MQQSSGVNKTQNVTGITIFVFFLGALRMEAERARRKEIRNCVVTNSQNHNKNIVQSFFYTYLQRNWLPEWKRLSDWDQLRFFSTNQRHQQTKWLDENVLVKFRRKKKCIFVNGCSASHWANGPLKWCVDDWTWSAVFFFFFFGKLSIE